MEIITVDAQVYKSLIRKIDRIYDYVKVRAERERKNQPDPSKEWVDDKEACDILKVSKRTLQRYRSNGKITYSLRGGVVRYTRAEIDRAMSGQMFRNTSEREAAYDPSTQEDYRKRKLAGNVKPGNPKKQETL